MQVNQRTSFIGPKGGGLRTDRLFWFFYPLSFHRVLRGHLKPGKVMIFKNFISGLEKYGSLLSVLGKSRKIKVLLLENYYR